jgi:hypothetical protein
VQMISSITHQLCTEDDIQFRAIYALTNVDEA